MEEVSLDPSIVRLKIGQLVRMLRVRAKLTQPELARKSGVPMATISRFERTGKLGLESLTRLLLAVDSLSSLDEYLDKRMNKIKFSDSQHANAQSARIRVRHQKRR